jgi:glycosyltransferase involved in cell wall biosynthesis
VVVDSGSTDRTIEIAQSLGARVELIEFEGFGFARQRAVKMATTEYVLCIDADEVVTPELAVAIGEILASEQPCDCYELPRITNFCGAWVMTSGWYPEYVLRLFRPLKASISDDLVHESIQCESNIARLPGLLLHFSYPDVATFGRKMRHYSILGAKRYVRDKGNIALIRVVINPVVVFVKKFLLQYGFLEGLTGLWIAVLSAAGQFCKYVNALKGVDR